MQFIDGERVDQAHRPASWSAIPRPPLVMGVDIARSRAATRAVIRFRRGLDARSIPPVKFRIPDLMLMAGRVIEQVRSTCRPDAVFLDAHRASAGACTTAWCSSAAKAWSAVDFGGKADRTEGGDAKALYANKRAEMWGFMKDWCRARLPARRSRPRGRPDRRRIRLRRRATPCSWSASRTCAAAVWPRPTTATRWRSPSPIPWRPGTSRKTAAPKS